MKKHLPALTRASALAFALILFAVDLPAKTATTARAKKAGGEKAPEKILLSSDADDDESEPEINGANPADFHCEMGNRLTIYKNDDDDQHIAIHWKQRLHRLTRIATSTGADRFENRKAGLVWVVIPDKGILLDAKKGRPLANECKYEEIKVIEDIATPPRHPTSGQ